MSKITDIATNYARAQENYERLAASFNEAILYRDNAEKQLIEAAEGSERLAVIVDKAVVLVEKSADGARKIHVIPLEEP